MAIFLILKNTVLLLVFMLSTCGNQPKHNNIDQNSTADGTAEYIEPPIIVAANRTEAYLPPLTGKNVAIVANQTSVIFKDSLSYTHLVDSLWARNINIKKVFAPEHGFRGEVDAGEKVAHGKDEKTGLPILSLYGK